MIDSPYLFRTEDFGATWTRIDGLPRGEFTHAIREDPVRLGLLYVGTEHGVRVWFDSGATWQSLQLNLPVVAVPDIKVEKHDLVIATHGRSFHVDYLAPLRQFESSVAAEPAHLFRPQGVYRSNAAAIDFVLSKPAQRVTLEILDASGAVLNEIPVRATPGAGHHRVSWNLRSRGATVFPGMVLEAPNPAQGITVPPGKYQVRLTADGLSRTQPPA